MNSGLKKFSNRERSARIKEATASYYDLIIIGGGITGAGIALDASLRGLKTILLEKNDFASGTSSKSTKLIHGGLRYLKQLEIGLVRESGLERAIAHSNACHLVHPENMVLPIVNNGSFSKYSASAAISVYDWLANVPAKDKKRVLNKEQAKELEPLLRMDILKSAIVYSEYRTDDARLTIELIKAARRNNSEAFNYLEVVDFIEENAKVKGVICLDNISGDEFCIHGEVIVNAGGPWVDQLRKINESESKSNLRLSKGVHIVIDRSKLPLNNSSYFDAFDGRMIFAIPRGDVVYVGTSDTDYIGNKDELKCSKEDAEYLLNALNRFFDVPEVHISDIKSTWTGLRPLIQQEGKSATEVSRKDEIFTSKNGLLSIAGGKLTGFRKMAERILAAVYQQSSKDFVPSRTEEYKIHHRPFSNYSDFCARVKVLSKQYEKCGLGFNTVEAILSNFGNDGTDLLLKAEMSPTLSTPENVKRLMITQLNYTIDYESVFSPMDFLERRTGWLYFEVNKVNTYLDFVSNHLAKTFELSEEQRQEHLLRAQKSLKNATLGDIVNPMTGAST